MEGEPSPSVALQKIPGRAGNIGQGQNRESTYYIFTGVVYAAADFTSFLSTLETLIAAQAATAVAATYTHKSGTVLLNGVSVWIGPGPPHIKTRKGSEMVLADWSIEVTVRE